MEGKQGSITMRENKAKEGAGKGLPDGGTAKGDTGMSRNGEKMQWEKRKPKMETN
jgi:hypothetical protein